MYTKHLKISKTPVCLSFFQGQKTGNIIEENDRIDFKCEDGYAKNMHINIICKVRGYALKYDLA